ncbi:MAG: phosphoribosylformylglycinamidine synthase subunit PurL [Nitrospinota bacterium]|nr:phosphoribosylformylglycinamidine synthase subunit PurL [Nitrospinota bacterium]
MFGKSYLEKHGLTREEFDVILEVLRRPPTEVELGIFSVMWSEHCSYKSSKLHLANLHTTGPQVVLGPGENAGAVDIGDGLAAVFKMESHNHPSFIEPYQGAATGVGGILRDIFTMGARPVALLNSIRFGDMGHDRTRYLLNGVVGGIAGYGNCIGVPTVGGETTFHHSYNNNILVNVFNIGVVRKDKIFLGRATGDGNPVVYVGARTGRDGIHGATMASAGLSDESEKKRPHVQVGDPFMEKKLLEACLELFKTDSVVGIQDMGAAGLTSSSVEMATRAGNGMELDLDKVPRREEGMTPYEVMLSESQERMLMVVKKGTLDQVKKLFNRWGLSVEVVGRVTDDNTIRVRDKGKMVAEIDLKKMHDTTPKFSRLDSPPFDLLKRRKLDMKSIVEPKDLNETMRSLLSSPNLCSKKWIWRQYDHQVMTNTVLKPGSDASVVRVKGTKKALAMSLDCNSRYCWLNPRLGAAQAVAEATRNVACSGARPLAITDCLNFGSPENHEVMWEFTQAIIGITEACEALNTPVVSGNVSFYNQTAEAPIWPTPQIGAVGLLEDSSLVVDQFFKTEGDLVILLGETYLELGGSEYLATIHGMEKGSPPSLNLQREASLQKLLVHLAHNGLVSSMHDVSNGGLAVALAEGLFGPHKNGEPHLGLEIYLNADIRADFPLFSESQSRVLISCHQSKMDDILQTAREFKTPAKLIGMVKKDRMVVKLNRAPVIDLETKELEEIWASSLSSSLTATRV